jgi:gamma-glutamylcyclotransferase (GGCT)/AIG2-like uncharacterized protein YtfP
MPDQGIPNATDLLFVYGTLRKGFRLHRHLLNLGATFVGEAKVRGELFDLGPYPGAKASADGYHIHGELYRLRRPVDDLEILDEIEEYVPDAPAQSQFIRASVDVMLNGSASRTAWIYWLGPKAPSIRQRVESGDYSKSGKTGN